MSDTCVTRLIVIGTPINQVETKVSLKNNFWPDVICCCLQTCHVLTSQVMVGNTCTLNRLVIGTTFNQF